MDKNFFKDLQILRNIEPDKDFVENTKRIVLAVSPGKTLTPKSFFGLVFAGGLAMILLAIVGLGSIFFTNSEPALSNSFDSDILRGELDNLAIDLQLDEIAYQQDINNTIASALAEISDSRINHLNLSILESEKGLIEENGEEKDSRIEDLLNKVLL